MIDYQTHHFKLIPPLAMAFAYTFTTNRLLRMQQELFVDIQKNDFSKLPLLHHLSATFKALMTDTAFAQLEIVRQSCGGAGFLKMSGF